MLETISEHPLAERITELRILHELARLRLGEPGRGFDTRAALGAPIPKSVAEEVELLAWCAEIAANPAIPSGGPSTSRRPRPASPRAIWHRPATRAGRSRRRVNSWGSRERRTPDPDSWDTPTRRCRCERSGSPC